MTTTAKMLPTNPNKQTMAVKTPVNQKFHNLISCKGKNTLFVIFAIKSKKLKEKKIFFHRNLMHPFTRLFWWQEGKKLQKFSGFSIEEGNDVDDANKP
jgi:hypothetical protein